jgi:hypothetical protein
MDKYTITLPADLRDMITAKPIRLNNWPSLTTELHTGSGLYAFWWLGEQSELTNDAMDKVQFKGPAVALEEYYWTHFTHRYFFDVESEYVT